MKTTLAGRLFNVPLLVESAYLETVCRFTQSRILGETIDLDYKGRAPTNSLNYFSMIDGEQSLVAEPDKGAEAQIAVIPVMGSLMHRANGLDAISSSGRGYNTIKNDINSSLRDESIGGVALHVATNGGEVSGNFDLSRWINEIQSQTDKPVWALVDESAYSAGYSIASSAARVHTTRSGGVGSIGVVVAHANYEKMMKKEGVQVTYVHAGKHKVDGNPYEALKGDALSSLQKDIEYHYSHFVELVANNRGLDQSAVRDTEAKTFNSDDALQLGLVDAVMSTDDSLQEMFEHINSPNKSKTYVSKQGSSPDASKSNDGSAVKNQEEGTTMTDEKKYSEAELQAEIDKAVLAAKPESQDSVAIAMLNQEGATIESVRAAMDMGLSAEQAEKFVAYSAKQPEGTDSKDKISADKNTKLFAKFEEFMANSEVNQANKNAGSQEAEDKQVVAFDAAAEHKRLKGDL